MLRPDYFFGKEDKMLELYQKLEDYIMKDIAMRLLKAKEMSGTADRMIWKLEQMGQLKSDILKKLAQFTAMTTKEIKGILQDAVLTSWKEDVSIFKEKGVNVLSPLDNPRVISIMNAQYIKSQGELENLTRTTILSNQKELVNMLDEVDMRVTSGVQSYTSAVCEVLDRYAGQGVRVDYPTGASRTLESAVRTCIVTSMNQTAAQVTNQYIVESKSEYVLVSAHLGARVQRPGQPYVAGHDNWQGKVYKIRGSEENYPNLLEMTGYDIDPVTGKGTVVNPLGLHGYNCRHSHMPWDKKLRNPYVDENGNLTIDTEENRKYYEKQQKQRAYERAIRKKKRQLLIKQHEIDMVAETDVKKILQEDYDKLAYQLRKSNKAYNDYCEENDLQKQYDRLKVSGFKRKQSSKANGRATAYQNSLNE